MGEMFLTIGTAMKWLGFALSPLFLLPFLVLLAPGLTARLAQHLITLIERITSAALYLAMWLSLIHI